MPRPSELHSVTVHFKYGINSINPLHDLGRRLMSALEQAGVGEYDGHGLAEDDSEGDYFMYGADAEEVFKIAHPILKEAEFMKGAVAVLRYGSMDVEAELVKIEI